MAELKINTVLNCIDGSKIKIQAKLGEGGQGYVYKVDYNGEEKALKWYKSNSIKNERWFKNNLQNNIDSGAPTSSFIWPITGYEK